MPSEGGKGLGHSVYLLDTQLVQLSGDVPARPNRRPKRKMSTELVNATEYAQRREPGTIESDHLPSRLPGAAQIGALGRIVALALSIDLRGRHDVLGGNHDALRSYCGKKGDRLP